MKLDVSFQFLGIPPKGEREELDQLTVTSPLKFPISRDPPEGGTGESPHQCLAPNKFPISRDPPEGGTTRGGYLERL